MRKAALIWIQCYCNATWWAFGSRRRGGDLKVAFERDLAEDIEPILDQIRAHKSEILDKLEGCSNAKARILDGHTVRKIRWETSKAVIFEDNDGRIWRHLRSYCKTWPVICERREP
jgi:hypothetical protein